MVKASNALGTGSKPKGKRRGEVEDHPFGTGAP